MLGSKMLGCECVSLSQFLGTCRKFHFLEALDGWWDAISLHQDVVLSPYTLMPLFRHAQDITGWCPTVWVGGRGQKRVWAQLALRCPCQSQPHTIPSKGDCLPTDWQDIPGFDWVIVCDSLSHLLH